MWGGRFEGASDERMAEFTSSIDFRQIACLDDIAGSIAHVHGLGQAGLLAPTRSRRWSADSKACGRMWGGGHVIWDPALEDVHMNLEVALREADRTGRGAAPHRPVPQRSGGHRHAAVAARTIDGLDGRWSRWSVRWSGWRTARARRSCRA